MEWLTSLSDKDATLIWRLMIVGWLIFHGTWIKSAQDDIRRLRDDIRRARNER